jgi:hypothetical protein
MVFINSETNSIPIIADNTKLTMKFINEKPNFVKISTTIVAVVPSLGLRVALRIPAKAHTGRVNHNKFIN